MFESLDEQIRHDRTETTAQRVLRWAAAVAVTLLVLGGLYFGVQLVD